MIYCKCGSTNVTKNDLNFANLKREGQPSEKMDSIKYEFICNTCGRTWKVDEEPELLYEKYRELREKTLMKGVSKNKLEKINPTHISVKELKERHVLAKLLIGDYGNSLDLSSEEWEELKGDIPKS